MCFQTARCGVLPDCNALPLTRLLSFVARAATMLDSFVDLMSQLVIFFAESSKNRLDPLYPVGQHSWPCSPPSPLTLNPQP